VNMLRARRAVSSCRSPRWRGALRDDASTHVVMNDEGTMNAL
jgi:hypothetical protein